MSNQSPSVLTRHEIKLKTDAYGNGLMCAGMGLESLANILGADGSEHGLDERDINGLLHAANALGLYVKQAGGSMSTVAESLAHDSSITANKPELRA